MDRVIPFRHWNPFAKIGWFRSKKNRLHLPVSAYLIEHPKGLVLFDTGWNVDTREKVVNRKYFLPISYGMLPEGQAIHEQLARLGHAPSSLDYVFLSHLDGDHVGGLMHVKDAKHILVSELEWAAANQSKTHIRYNPKRWSGIDVQTFQYTKTVSGRSERALTSSEMGLSSWSRRGATLRGSAQCSSPATTSLSP